MSLVIVRLTMGTSARVSPARASASSSVVAGASATAVTGVVAGDDADAPHATRIPLSAIAAVSLDRVLDALAGVADVQEVGELRLAQVAPHAWRLPDPAGWKAKIEALRV